MRVERGLPHLTSRVASHVLAPCVTCTTRVWWRPRSMHRDGVPDWRECRVEWTEGEIHGWLTASIEPWKSGTRGTRVVTEVVRGDGSTHVVHKEAAAFYRPHLLRTYEGPIKAVRTGSEYGFSYMFITWFADPAKKRADIGGVSATIPPFCNSDSVCVSSCVTHVGQVPLVGDDTGAGARARPSQPVPGSAGAVVAGTAAKLRLNLKRAALATVMVEALGACACAPSWVHRSSAG